MKSMSDGGWFVYLLECKGKRIYTGVTSDLEVRMKAHAVGDGAKFTQWNSPVRLLAICPQVSQRDALRLEAQVKRMPAISKRLLVELWLKQYPVDESIQKVFSAQ